MIHQCFDLKRVILGRDRYELAMPDDVAAVQSFADSLAEYIRQLQLQRDEASAKVAELERECDGLKLALKRLS